MLATGPEALGQFNVFMLAIGPYVIGRIHVL